MTTLFRPVLIETVEQAEKLPEGTLAYIGTGSSMLTAARLPLMGGRDYGWQDFAGPRANPAMVGWTALAPVEAEEETRRFLRLDRAPYDFSFGPGDEIPEDLYDGPPRTRLVTPWTPVTSP